MMKRVIHTGAAFLLAGAVAALGSGCGGEKSKPLEQLSEQDASKKANDMFREKMGQMGKGATGEGAAISPAGAPAPGSPGGPPPGGPKPPGQ